MRLRVALIAFLTAILATALGAAFTISSRFTTDLLYAAERSSWNSRLLITPCGPIEVQEAGDGIPLLMIHGSGGGHDQGMAWAHPLLQKGVRIIAMSRFGYLRTPMPADGTPQAQADAHICVLDALAIAKSAVMGVSAGAPSALQTVIRHPQRVRSLILVVPIVWKPGEVADSAPPIPDWKDAMMLRLLESDFLLWSALHVARGLFIQHVLATPPELVAAAGNEDRLRVHALAQAILPVSRRAAGLRADTALGKSLGPYALATIAVPTLVASARDDGFGTYAGAEYTASEIAGARFLGFDHGGHLLVGHNDSVIEETAALLRQTASR